VCTGKLTSITIRPRQCTSFRRRFGQPSGGIHFYEETCYYGGMLEAVVKSKKEMQKIAGMLAKELKPMFSNQAIILALEGNLGSGKTTFTQGFAHALGVREKVSSPTFVLLKIYNFSRAARFRHLIHIDCYRLDSPKDLLHLGFKNFLADKDAIILIEWADRIRKLMPKDSLWLRFQHGSKINERILTISGRPMSKIFMVS